MGAGGITQTFQKRCYINCYQVLLERAGSELKVHGITQLDLHSPGGVITLGQRIVLMLDPCPEHSTITYVVYFVESACA